MLLSVQNCFRQHRLYLDYRTALSRGVASSGWVDPKESVLSVLQSLVTRRGYQPKRLVTFVWRPYARLRISEYLHLTRASTRTYSTPNRKRDNRIWKAQSSTHKQRLSMRPATPAHIPLTRVAMSGRIQRTMQPQLFRPKQKRCNKGAGIVNTIFSPSRVSIDLG